MKPIDRLAEIKITQRALRSEARQIRQQLLAGEVGLVGDEHLASIRHHVTIRRLAGHGGNGVHEAKPANGWAAL